MLYRRYRSFIVLSYCRLEYGFQVTLLCQGKGSNPSGLKVCRLSLSDAKKKL
jgi:hypothetical protein